MLKTSVSTINRDLSEFEDERSAFNSTDKLKINTHMTSVKRKKDLIEILNNMGGVKTAKTV